MNNISSDVIRGHIDTIILKLLTKEDSYGYKLYKLILETTDYQYELKETSLYSSLRRLEKEKYIISYWGDETQGGRRKYYSITENGKKKLKQNLLEWQKMKFIMDKILY